ncbi:MAG: transcriptional regulator [Chthonomonadaceae bacterium]|nr:transcriptional regulator [Chthonomonadaceae bacterium]
MQENRADIIFHPIRIRVVQALFGERRLTTQQLVAILEGPSIATLYRHLNRMVQAGILAVVEERPIRGTFEKVYALAHEQAATFQTDEVRAIGREDRMRHFTTLIGTLLNDYDRYLSQEEIALGESGVILRQEALYVTEEETGRISAVFQETLAPYMHNPPDSARRRHLLTTILLPVVEPTE